MIQRSSLYLSPNLADYEMSELFFSKFLKNQFNREIMPHTGFEWPLIVIELLGPPVSNTKPCSCAVNIIAHKI